MASADDKMKGGDAERKARKPRSASGQGGYYWRESKGLWEYRLTLNGERSTFYGKTQGECRKKAREAQERVRKGIPALPERVSVAQYLERWLSDVAKPNVRPSAYTAYESNCRRFLLPALGRKQLSRLAPEDLQRLYAELLSRGLAPRTVRQLHTVAHNALQVATEWGLVPRNVADVVRPPRTARPEYTLLTGDEAIRVLAAIRETSLDSIVTLALTTGMREAELLGLRWRDIDFAAGILDVRQQAKRVRHEGWSYPEPKSATSRRSVVLTPQGIAALHRQERAVGELRRLAGDRWEELGLVHPNRVGRPIEPQNLLRRWYRFLAGIGLSRVTIHELRHSTATLLKALGVKMEVIQEILGHSSITVTSGIYADRVNELHVEAMKRLGSFLAGQNGGGEKLIGVPIGVPPPKAR